MEEEIYALQHFGFTAMQVTLERKHLLQSLLDSAFESMIKKVTTSEATVNLLKLKKVEIAKNMLKSMETELDGLAAMDRKYFLIPDHVLLAEDYEHIYNYTADQEKEVDEEIDGLKRLFLENNVMIKSLEQQEEQFEILKPYIEQHLIMAEKTKAAIELLNHNKLSYIQKLIRATKVVANKLTNDDLLNESK